jgi:hypothetical protein
MAKRRQKRRTKRASRVAVERPERSKDPRLVAVRATEMNGEKLPPDTWAQVLSPVLMDDGKELLWYPPQPVAFNLIEAKRARDSGVKSRRNIMAKLKRRSSGRELQPTNSTTVLNCVRDLQSAVLFAFTAIESLANHAIDMLDDSFILAFKKRTYAHKELVGLGIDDKLKRVLPKMDGGEKIAGTEVWERFRKLKFIRDELLHVKQRGLDPHPEKRTAYDRLLVGEADGCVEDAIAVVEGAWPGFLPLHVREALR